MTIVYTSISEPTVPTGSPDWAPAPRHAPGDVGVRHAICPWRQGIPVLRYHAGGAAGRGGVRVIAPVQRAWRIRRVPGCRTPERETQNCGDGQFSADRAAWEWRDYGSETGGISRRKWPGRCLPIGFQITYIILFQYITRIQFTRIGHPIIKVTV